MGSPNSSGKGLPFIQEGLIVEPGDLGIGQGGLTRLLCVVIVRHDADRQVLAYVFFQAVDQGNHLVNDNVIGQNVKPSWVAAFVRMNIAEARIGIGRC